MPTTAKPTTDELLAEASLALARYIEAASAEGKSQFEIMGAFMARFKSLLDGSP